MNFEEYMELKQKEVEKLKSLLKTIKTETVPKEGHPDPLALLDCWKEVEELVNKIEKDISL